MSNKQKKALAIHDISCVGRCSLTEALPVLSAAGIETAVMPTAVLSTHTGGFTGYTFRDLTEDMLPIAKHWKTLDLKFDAIYTGYLGSFHQLEIVCEIFDMFREKDNLILIDPVMADNGKLYPSFSPDFPKGMRKLCEHADILIPNITEASLMTDYPYTDRPYTEEYIEGLLKELAKIGPKHIVLTGVTFNNHELGAATYDTSTGQIEYIMSEVIPGYYHGTGDLFGSAFLGALLNGFSLSEAVRITIDLVVASIKSTYHATSDLRYGVNFEQNIPSYIKDLKLI